MSVEAIALVLNHSHAEGRDKLVLIGIANHEGDGGAWPTIATLQRYANCSEPSVHRSIRQLIALGELTVERQAGGSRTTDPRYRPNLYRINLRCPPECDRTTHHRTVPEPVDNPVDNSVMRGVTADTPEPVRGVRSDDLGVSQLTPESSYQSPTHPRTFRAETAAGDGSHRDEDLEPQIDAVARAFAAHRATQVPGIVHGAGWRRKVSDDLLARRRDEIVRLLEQHRPDTPVSLFVGQLCGEPTNLRHWRNPDSDETATITPLFAPGSTQAPTGGGSDPENGTGPHSARNRQERRTK